MFTIVYKNILDQDTYVSWHLQDRKPSVPDSVHKLIADGDELELIKLEFDNIPMPANSKRVVWDGDFAKFLYANIIIPLK